MNKEELKQKYGDTEVFVISNELVKQFNTFTTLDKHNKYTEIFNNLGLFIPRYDAELNYNFRQIIPYCLITYEDYYFMTRRLEGDARLTGKYSIGIGGHIEKVDGVNNDYITTGMMRELNEEIDIDEEVKSINLIGIICSDNTDVDKVHLGLIYVVEVNGFNVKVKEHDTLTGEWIYKGELKNFDQYYEGELESWSQIATKEFIK